MVSPCRIRPKNTNKRRKKTSSTNSNENSHREPDIERPQMTPNDFKTSQTNSKSNSKNKNFLKTGSIHEGIELSDQYSDEISDNNDI